MKYLALLLILTTKAVNAEVDGYIENHEQVCLDADEPSVCFDQLLELKLVDDFRNDAIKDDLTNEEFREKFKDYKRD